MLKKLKSQLKTLFSLKKSILDTVESHILIMKMNMQVIQVGFLPCNVLKPDDWRSFVMVNENEMKTAHFYYKKISFYMVHLLSSVDCVNKHLMKSLRKRMMLE